MRNSSVLPFWFLVLGGCGVDASGIMADPVTTVSAACPAPSFVDPMDCAGAPELCDRRYNEVTFLGTHNSYASTSQGYATLIANQRATIRQQLESGVRLINLDVHATPHATACHSNASIGPAGCTLGARSLDLVHLEVREWLCENPDEVLTIAFEAHAEWPLIWRSLVDTGLSEMLWVQAKGEGQWPTLREMIHRNKRIVLFVEDKSSTQSAPQAFSWTQLAHSEVAAGPAYKATSVTQLLHETRCDRADSTRPFFYLEHFANDRSDPEWMSGGNPHLAKEANGYDEVRSRAFTCLDEWAAQRPEHPATINFITVDFAEGNIEALLRVVTELNDQGGPRSRIAFSR